jgi:hypothetical protein
MLTRHHDRGSEPSALRSQQPPRPRGKRGRVADIEVEMDLARKEIPRTRYYPCRIRARHRVTERKAYNAAVASIPPRSTGHGRHLGRRRVACLSAKLRTFLQKKASRRRVRDRRCTCPGSHHRHHNYTCFYPSVSFAAERGPEPNATASSWMLSANLPRASRS